MFSLEFGFFGNVGDGGLSRLGFGNFIVVRGVLRFFFLSIGV